MIHLNEHPIFKEEFETLFGPSKSISILEPVVLNQTLPLLRFKTIISLFLVLHGFSKTFLWFSSNYYNFLISRRGELILITTIIFNSLLKILVSIFGPHRTHNASSKILKLKYINRFLENKSTVPTHIFSPAFKRTVPARPSTVIRDSLGVSIFPWFRVWRKKASRRSEFHRIVLIWTSPDRVAAVLCET
jgi:hypothetical protein